MHYRENANSEHALYVGGGGVNGKGVQYIGNSLNSQT